MITALNDEEMWDLASLVERHHEIFYIIFGINAVVWDDEIKTLGVMFPKVFTDKPTIHINKELWDTLSDYDKEFLVCHESLHILLRHNVRDTQGPNKDASHKLKNIAQDVSINEMLLSMFDFDFDALDYCKTGCFVSTVFPDEPNCPRNETFNYYLDKLVNKEEKQPGSTDNMQDSLDQHDPQEALPKEVETKDLPCLSQQQLETISEKLGEQGVKDINKQASSYSSIGTASFSNVLPIYRPVKPFSFHQHIKDLKRSRFKQSERLTSTFTHVDRRYVNLSSSNGLHLPGTIEERKTKKEKLDTRIFMDVSGSCTKFVPDFYKMYGHIEQFQEFFDIRTYTFNTRVTEVDLKTRNLSLGGGTNFQIIEDECKASKKYPDLVIVITDGEAPRFNCSMPENWMWFLITDRTHTYAIDPRAKVIERKEVQL